MHLQQVLGVALSASTLATPQPSYRDSLLSLHKSLVSISSLSNHEAEVGDYLIEYFKSRNYTSLRQDVKPDSNSPSNATRFNVLAWPGDAKSLEAKVIVTSHIDTVPPHIPYSIEDGLITEHTKISGRGSVDAKASVASMITAVDQLVSANKVSPNQVALLFVVSEETGGTGMTAFDASLPAKRPFHSVIFGEPTENKLACGHKGMLAGTIQANGVAAHSGYPKEGKNANLLLARAVLKLDEADLGSSDRFGNTTLNPAIWQGGVASNVIPAKATVRFLARVAAAGNKGHKLVEERIRRVLDDVDKHGFELNVLPGGGPVECDCDVPGE